MESILVPKAIYDKHEAIFIVLIHHTTTKEQLVKDFKVKYDPFVDVLRELFGSKPNLSNLKAFFKNPVT
jgi:hypothetical protein